MRQLFPVVLNDVDPVEVYRQGDRPGSPWVVVNMISSVDGATAVEGRSGALGGAADKKVFAAIRATADVIFVGAGTARAENYGPPTVGARLAIVSASLDFPLDARVFSDGYRPLFVTSSTADAARRAAIETVADVVEAGAGRVDMRAAVAHFDGVVLCEGGPSLNGQLIADGLVDEMCLTLAPLLVSGDSARVAHGLAPGAPERMTLAHLLEQDGYVFLRYVRSS